MPQESENLDQMRARNLEEARATPPLTGGHYAAGLAGVVMEARRFLQGHEASDVGGVTRAVVVGIAAGLQRERDLFQQVFTAMEQGDHRGLEELLRNSPGINLNADNEDGTTPLLLAVANRDAPMCKILLAHGARPDDPAVVQGRLITPREAVRDSEITKLFDMARRGELAGGAAVTTVPSPSLLGGPGL
jgi:hypothetical protein